MCLTLWRRNSEYTGILETVNKWAKKLVVRLRWIGEERRLETKRVRGREGQTETGGCKKRKSGGSRRIPMSARGATPKNEVRGRKKNMKDARRGKGEKEWHAAGKLGSVEGRRLKKVERTGWLDRGEKGNRCECECMVGRLGTNQ